MAESNVAPLKTVSESIREHETFKYYPSLLANTRHNLDTQPVPSEELSTSSDTVLTALAQLGACQTGTARSLISLFDNEFQHVVAEATPTLPLVPSLRLPERGEDLWLCGTAIPRRFGVCEASLLPCDASTREEAENPTLLPLTLVPNLQEDSRFAGSPYCKPGSPAKFYAAVPLRTSRGINIGVYCVIDTVRRDEWDPALTRVLRNISKTIMEHIEAKRTAVASRQGARMNRGIGSFVDGASTISEWPSDELTNAAQEEVPLADALNADLMDLRQREADETSVRESGIRPGEPRLVPAPIKPPLLDHSPAPASSDKVPRPLRSSSSGFVASHSGSARNGKFDLSGNGLASVFDKASNVIREAIEVEGCVFFDARVKKFSGLNANSLSSEDEDYSKSHPPSDFPSPSGQTVPMCRILGFSTTEGSSINGSRSSALKAAIPESFMARLLRRYPNGKIFNFDSKGDLRLTDSSEDDSPRASPGLPTEPTAGSKASGRTYPGARHREGRAILRIFPNARSVAFVPVRDSGKGRWTAGSFVYTNTPARIFTAAGELSYLTAFGVLAMAETLRMETLQAEKAKSDALDSLSHELRSPLHGVVLAAELLHDTALTGLQGNILHTIEICGRTLMDTLDHLLDFSKINNFTSRAKRKPSVTPRSPDTRQIKPASIEDGMKSLQSNIAVDCIVEEVVESVFTGYNFQYASLAQLSKSKDDARFADVDANSKMDLHSAVQDFGTRDGAGGHIDLAFSHVFISLYIDPRCTWIFHSQPGALRRILMNIFGNALKYTQRGTIVVSVRQETLPATCYDSARQNVVFSVADTGKGMSEDYLQHDAFTPFSQEDPLAAGTGLGLSLVKQITDSLGGSVVVDSRLGIGTTVAVKLPMMPAVEGVDSSSPEIEDTDFKDHIADLKALRVVLRGFRDAQGTGKLPKPTRHGFSHEMTEVICRDWLKMEVIPDETVHVPDIILATESAMPDRNSRCSASPPCVVVCMNSLIAFDHATSKPNAQGVFEFISQPLGPRKLARVLRLACQRWHSLQASSSPAIEQTTLDLVSKLAVSEEPTRKIHGVQTTTTEILKDSPPQANMDEAPSEYVVPNHTVLDSAAPTSNMSSPTVVSIADSATPSPPPNMPAAAAPAHRYLLVDDNDINLRILSSHVKRLGLPIATARNGLEAFQAFCAAPESFDCVFMDISMPVMDGFEATRRIRAFELEHQLNPTTIIGLSALASMGSQQEAYISGLDLFLTKPVRLKALEAILQSRNML